MYVLEYLAARYANPNDTVLSEFRLLCSGVLYNARVQEFEWRKIDAARSLLTESCKLAVVSHPLDEYAQESSLFFASPEHDLDPAGNSTHIFLREPDDDIAQDMAELFKMATPWAPDRTLEKWIRDYVLELSYTSWRMQPYAIEMKADGPPFQWDSDRRAMLRADLDAAFFHMYQLDRNSTLHIIDSFFALRKYEECDEGEYRTKHLVLEAYDRMAAAIENAGKGWKPLAAVPAG
jgi:hypothetical protein